MHIRNNYHYSRRVLEKMSFIAMGVMKNYVSIAYMDRDVLHYMICQLTMVIFISNLFSLFFIVSEFCLKFKLYLCEFLQRTYHMECNFVFPSFSLFF
jgi:hypothetical protein